MTRLATLLALLLLYQAANATILSPCPDRGPVCGRSARLAWGQGCAYLIKRFNVTEVQLEALNPRMDCALNYYGCLICISLDALSPPPLSSPPPRRSPPPALSALPPPSPAPPPLTSTPPNGTPRLSPIPPPQQQQQPPPVLTPPPAVLPPPVQVSPPPHQASPPPPSNHSPGSPSPPPTPSLSPPLPPPPIPLPPIPRAMPPPQPNKEPPPARLAPPPKQPPTPKLTPPPKVMSPSPRPPGQQVTPCRRGRGGKRKCAKPPLPLKPPPKPPVPAPPSPPVRSPPPLRVPKSPPPPRQPPRSPPPTPPPKQAPQKKQPPSPPSPKPPPPPRPPPRPQPPPPKSSWSTDLGGPPSPPDSSGIAVGGLPGNNPRNPASPYHVDAAAVLSRLNLYRSLHNVPALTWSDRLMQSAQDWADNCMFQTSPSDYGETLALGYGTIGQAIDSWYNEERRYDYSTSEWREDSAHFTQLVWMRTYMVGCAIGVCPDGVNNGPVVWLGKIYVCHFFPPGNYPTQMRRNVFPPTGDPPRGRLLLSASELDAMQHYHKQDAPHIVL